MEGVEGGEDDGHDMGEVRGDSGETEQWCHGIWDDDTEVAV